MSNQYNNIEILIVEDSPTQALQLQYILQKHNYGVSIAQNGVEGINYLKQRKPTLIVSDVLMPEMDGYQFCSYVKKDENLRDIPVILLTTLSDPLDIVKGLECDADNFIIKPYEERFIISRIQYILINRELRQNSAAGMGFEIFFAGKKHFLNVERIQIIDLLLSSYELAVQQYHEVQKANTALRRAHEEQKLLTQELKTLSLFDDMTKLHNRRGFFTLAEQQLKIAQRMNKKMLLLYADLDGLKWINDTLGHQEGDKAIVETAEVLKKTFRDADIIARLGGDEFAVFAIEASSNNAETLTHRLQETVSARNAIENRKYKLSISVGVTEYDSARPCSLDKLLAQADNLMYEQKRRRQKTL